MRASGDPYFSHPLEVAGILTELKLDADTIVTGLLHDTVEDTVATIDEISDTFGPSIAHLVDGVTKLSKLELLPFSCLSNYLQLPWLLGHREAPERT